ncbi:ABC transporter permease [Lacunimicrobium album]
MSTISPQYEVRREDLLFCAHPALDRWSDRINPLLIKEINQQLKSRLFLMIYLLFVLLVWGSSLYMLMMQPQTDQPDFEAGDLLFSLLYKITIFPLCFAIPLGIHQRMRDEFHMHTIEMLTITTLSSGRIFRGKLMCGLLQSGLFLFASLPFLVFCYLLKGIGIVEILTVVAGTVFTLLCFYQVTILYSALSRTRIWEYLSRMSLVFFSTILYFALFFSADAVVLGGISSVYYLVGVLVANTPLYFSMLIFLDAAHEQFKPLRLMRPPFRVRINGEGKVIFLPRLLYQEVPEEYRDPSSNPVKSNQAASKSLAKAT